MLDITTDLINSASTELNYEVDPHKKKHSLDDGLNMFDQSDAVDNLDNLHAPKRPPGQQPPIILQVQNIPMSIWCQSKLRMQRYPNLQMYALPLILQ